MYALNVPSVRIWSSLLTTQDMKQATPIANKENKFMFENSGQKNNPTASIQSMPGNKTTIATSADVGESPLTTAANNEVVSPTPSRKVSFIGSSVVFRGELSAEEEIIIQGTVEGTVAPHAKIVVVGKEGRVRALIHANSVRIEGQVDGDIHGDDFVELIKGAKVSGDIYSPCVSIEKGVQFNGKVTMAPQT